MSWKNFREHVLFLLPSLMVVLLLLITKALEGQDIFLENALVKFGGLMVLLLSLVLFAVAKKTPFNWFILIITTLVGVYLLSSTGFTSYAVRDCAKQDDNRKITKLAEGALSNGLVVECLRN